VREDMYSDKPSCTRTRENEPSIELMAKAFIDLYDKIQEQKRVTEKLLKALTQKKDETVLLGIPEVMKVMGIGRVAAEKLMWGNNFHTIQSGNRKLVHREVLEKWLKGELKS
jgi:stalled ribosome rescue protein Dom34